MPSLLSIPEELRDNILEIVLLAERSPPLTVGQAEEHRLPPCTTPYVRKENDIHHRINAWDYGPSHVRYEDCPGLPISNAAPLLRVNKSLHTQTKRAISRLWPAGKVRYKLDVLLVNESALWPTWLHVPFLTTEVGSVDVTFRVSGRLGGDGLRSSAFCIGDGSPEQIVWCFYYLLEHFLMHGVVPSTKAQLMSPTRQARSIVVHNMNLHYDVCEPALLPPSDSVAEHRNWQEYHRDRNSGRTGTGFPPVDYAIHPLWLAQKNYGNLCGLASMSYHTSGYGMLLYDHVGRFRVTGPTEPPGRQPESALPEPFVRKLALGGFLARLECSPVTTGAGWRNTGIYTDRMMGHEKGDCRVLSFWNWKWRTMGLRRERGLDVAGDEEKVKWPTLTKWREWQVASQRSSERDDSDPWKCTRQECGCLETGLGEWLEKQENGQLEGENTAN